jgi:hypothetical protein
MHRAINLNVLVQFIHTDSEISDVRREGRKHTFLPASVNWTRAYFVCDLRNGRMSKDARSRNSQEDPVSLILFEKHHSTVQGLRGKRLMRFQHSRDAGASMQFGQNGLGSVVIGFARI